VWRVAHAGPGNVASSRALIGYLRGARVRSVFKWSMTGLLAIPCADRLMNDVRHHSWNRRFGHSGAPTQADPFIGIHSQGSHPLDWPPLSNEIDLYLISEGVSYSDLIAGERAHAARNRRTSMRVRFVVLGMLAVSLSLAMWLSW